MGGSGVVRPLTNSDLNEERSFFRRTVSLFLQLVVVISRNGAGEGITNLNPCLWHFGAWAVYLAWENSQGHHWFPRGMTSEQRLQKFHTDYVNCPYLDQGGSSDWPCRERNLLKPIRNTSHIWVMARHQYGISLLVPQASFRVASRNVGCVLRLRRLRSSEILISRSGIGKTKQITWHGSKQCDCCSRSLLLLTPTTWFSLVRKRNRNAKSESERDRW